MSLAEMRPAQEGSLENETANRLLPPSVLVPGRPETIDGQADTERLYADMADFYVEEGLQLRQRAFALSEKTDPDSAAERERLSRSAETAFSLHAMLVVLDTSTEPMGLVEADRAAIKNRVHDLELRREQTLAVRNASEVAALKTYGNKVRAAEARRSDKESQAHQVEVRAKAAVSTAEHKAESDKAAARVEYEPQIEEAREVSVMSRQQMERLVRGELRVDIGAVSEQLTDTVNQALSKLIHDMIAQNIDTSKLDELGDDAEVLQAMLDDIIREIDDELETTSAVLTEQAASEAENLRAQGLQRERIMKDEAATERDKAMSAADHAYQEENKRIDQELGFLKQLMGIPDAHISSQTAHNPDHSDTKTQVAPNDTAVLPKNEDRKLNKQGKDDGKQREASRREVLDRPLSGGALGAAEAYGKSVAMMGYGVTDAVRFLGSKTRSLMGENRTRRSLVAAGMSAMLATGAWLIWPDGDESGDSRYMIDATACQMVETEAADTYSAPANAPNIVTVWEESISRALNSCDVSAITESGQKVDVLRTGFSELAYAVITVSPTDGETGLITIDPAVNATLAEQLGIDPSTDDPQLKFIIDLAYINSRAAVLLTNTEKSTVYNQEYQESGTYNAFNKDLARELGIAEEYVDIFAGLSSKDPELYQAALQRLVENEAWQSTANQAEQSLIAQGRL